MADFNPYREWLQIQSAMPDYYALLGLPALESDSAQINAGFQRQAARVAPHLAGEHSGPAQRLMSELAEARVTLLTPTARRAYDLALSAAHQQATPSPQPKKQRWAQPTSGPGQDDLLPPAAIPGTAAIPGRAAPAPQPIAEPAAMQPQPIPQALPMPHVAQPGWQVPGQAPPAAEGYAMPYGGYPAQPAAQPAYNYESYGYGAPQAYAATPSASEAPWTTEAPVPSLAGAPESSYRPVRRRSSAGPALAGLLVATAGVVGVVYWAVKKDPTLIAVNQPAADGDANQQAAAPLSSQAGDAPSKPAAMPSSAGPWPTGDRRPPETPSGRPAADRTASTDASPRSPAATTHYPPDNVKPVVPPPPDASPPANTPTPVLAPTKPPPDEKMADEKMADEKMANEKMPDEKPPDEKRADEKPADEKPADEKPADSGEAAAVARSLEAARTALANRNLSSAQDHLDEAILAASAPDTEAEVARVQALITYVDGFWKAAGQQLVKLEAGEELEIGGEMASVVDANENLLALRVRGQSKSYKFPQKVPAKIAVYLARRWLAKGEPGTDLALAAFYLVEKNGDLGEAQRLLESAWAAGANVELLTDELAWRKQGSNTAPRN